MRTDHWGIIYCPYEGSRRSRKRWQQICARLTAVGQPFDFVQSEGAGSIERLAAMLTANGYGTIVVVGGDAALNSALNGMLSALVPGQQRPRLGILPNGAINSFARYWGFRVSTPETGVDALLRGRVRMIDVGVARWIAFNGEQHRQYFFNSINVGLVADIVKLRRRNHSLWGGIRWLRELTNALMLLLNRHSARVNFTINDEVYSQRVTTLCIGSCTGYGQTPSAVPYNGMLDVSVVRRPPLLQAFTALLLLLRGRFLSQKGISVWRTRHVELSHIGHVTVSCDGRAIKRRITSLTADVEQEVQPFLIP